MPFGLAAALVVMLFVVLLLVGRGQIEKGANPAVANGVVLLVLSILGGQLALGVIASWPGW